MVRKIVIDTCAEMHTRYLLKSGQTLENTKASERTLVLIVPKNAFQRLVNYTTEEYKIMEQQEKEFAKLVALKNVTSEKTKSWDSTIENIKTKQKEEYLLKNRKAGEERKIFVKKMAEKKAAERAEVVKQARMLLLQKKPLCRRINSAFLTSECFRELNNQVKFQQIIKNINKEQNAAYANSIRTDIARYEEQKKRETEEQIRKMKNYRMDLKKQIERYKYDNKLKAVKELKSEKRLNNTAQELQHMKEKEMQGTSDKKKKLHRFLKNAMEEKERFKLKLKDEEEIQDLVLEIYGKTKDQIQKIDTLIIMKEMKEKECRKQIIVEHYNALLQIRKEKEQKILEKTEEKKEAIEAEKLKSEKKRKEAMCARTEEYKLQHQAFKIKTKNQRQEKNELKNWEMIQRFKKDEFDKRNNSEENKRQWQQKLIYRNELQKDIEGKRIERKYIKEMSEVEDISIKALLENANQKILLYGNEILEESKDVRPLYPIMKAIQECKKDMD